MIGWTVEKKRLRRLEAGNAWHSVRRPDDGMQVPETLECAMTSGNTPQSRPSNITIKLPPGPVINLTCYGFHLYAEDFLSAERVYARRSFL